MRLSELLRLSQLPLPAPGTDPEIRSLHYRSREVVPGGLFVAVQGETADGHDYIQDAFARGAAAVVAQRPGEGIVQVPDSRLALAALGAAFYGNPSDAMTLVGVTGTNGKTTITYLVEAILTAAGHKVGVIGTVNCRYAGKVFESNNTTPESLDLQGILADMKAAGVTHVIMEVSSHGIDLNRVAFCHYDVGAFTNLTQDHLDYHGTLGAYWACKKRFFTENLLSGPKGSRAVAVLNMDTPHGRELAGTLPSPPPVLMTYGRKDTNRVYPREVTLDITGIRGVLSTPAGDLSFASPLVGAHNLENLLCAGAIATALGVPLSAIRDGIGKTEVPGRLERVPVSSDPAVFVDYAHTPDALENVLSTLKKVSPGRLICIFGCGGDRDRGKRPLMGEIAARLADLAVVTSDNPRTETPEGIITEILVGVRKVLDREISGNPWTGEHAFMIEPDRACAIKKGIAAACSGDVVLIAGKGHETYQILGTEKHPFDDRMEAARALAGLSGEGAPHPIPWTGTDILEATGGVLLSGEEDASFDGLGIDSRAISEKDLFVAIVGQTHDGHAFCEKVAAAGGRGFLVNEHATLPLDAWRRDHVFCVAVPDTTQALGDLASYHRYRNRAKVVAVTGSCGKTSTREMTVQVLSRRFRTHSPKKNFNNEIGVPLTLLAIAPSHDWAVAELGMNHPGEIARLGEIALPDIGVITNVGPAHLEGLGSVENVMAAKGELLSAIQKGGVAVLNADDPRGLQLAGQVSGRKILFGESDLADIRAEDITSSGPVTRFTLVLPGEKVPVTLSTPGRFMVSNALAAASVGHLAGLSGREIRAGLEAFRPVTGRMTLVETRAGIFLLDDTYNANPLSMGAAVGALRDARGEGRGFVVLGDMYELGEGAETYHREIGKLAAESGVSGLYAVGTFADAVIEGASAAGMAPENGASGDIPRILSLLTPRLSSGDWVLVKGSRAAGMERVVSDLIVTTGGRKD